MSATWVLARARAKGRTSPCPCAEAVDMGVAGCRVWMWVVGAG